VRKILRLVVLLAVASLIFTGVVVTVPTVIRGIYRGGSTSVAAPLTPLTSTFDEGSTVYASDDKTILATLHAAKTSLPVKLSAVAPILIHAVLDTEDERFYQHGGIDAPSTIRALLNNSAGNNLQGGSTITQQLVKQVYLNSQRKISRKIREAVIADRLEKLYTKNEILDAYLNTIYLGSGAYGVEAAAKAYWNETAAQLTLPQAALLAGLIQAPSGDDPVNYPAAARIRRGEVLARMVHYHTITQAQANAANAKSVPTSATITPQRLTGIDGYYVAQVETQLLAAGSPLGSTLDQREQLLFSGGLKIYTNLNTKDQAEAEAAVVAGTPANDQGLQEALVSINPANGNVMDMIAGQNYAKASFDIVTQGREQPGSGFKIFTLLAALGAGDSVYDPVDGTAPCAIAFPGNTGYLKNPAHNDEGDGQVGETTVLNATAQSLNCAFIRIAHQIGLPAVIKEAEKLGIPASEIGGYSQTPSVVIGTAPVAPIQMAAAYATLAAGGTYHAPHFLNHIIDRTGTVLYREKPAGKKVVSTKVVAEADQAFQAVVQYGTGRVAQIPGREVAGKTGTNSGPNSAWFNGYTPQLETTVWMGNPKGGVAVMRVDGQEVYGASYPAPTVHAFMAAYLANLPFETFPPALPPNELPQVMTIPEACNCVPFVPTTVGPSTTLAPTSTTTPGSPTSPTTTPLTTPSATTPPSTTPPSTAPPSTTPPTTKPAGGGLSPASST
jgi:membrane peptidoglycan carboxypeptidase